MRKLVPLVIVAIIVVWAGLQKTERADIPIAVPSKANRPTISETAVTKPSELFLVSRVIDGDTIEVETPNGIETVRYIGVDTPEMNDKRQEVKELAEEATKKNEELVLDKKVKLEKDISERDRYGRLLRYIWLKNGTFVNLELVKQGYAKVATYPPDVRHSADFWLAEQTARQKGLGLWK